MFIIFIVYIKSFLLHLYELLTSHSSGRSELLFYILNEEDLNESSVLFLQYHKMSVP
jgi:hypothetical protein